MNQVFPWMAFLLFYAGIANRVCAQPQFYNYNTLGQSNSIPFNLPNGKQVQVLYMPGDFNQPSPAPAGDISSISFMINQNLGPWTYSGLPVDMRPVPSGVYSIVFTTGEIRIVRRFIVTR